MFADNHDPSAVTSLEIGDIQALVLRPRPTPYFGRYILLFIGSETEGRTLIKRIVPHIAPSDKWWIPELNVWTGIALSYQGLCALGLPKSSLESFPDEFKEGMASRADILNDHGANSPSNWEYPLGSKELHVAISIYANNKDELELAVSRYSKTIAALQQIRIIYTMDFNELPGGRNQFGFRDGLHNPHVEGSGIPFTAANRDSVKPGEFIMGYLDENGEVANKPEPEILRKNGTFLAFRKFHTNVAAFRTYLRSQCSSQDEQELLAAKMVGRWKSGAPLVLSPKNDDESLGADPERNNIFNYSEDTAGQKCPFSAHIRRVNPRDALDNDVVSVNLHHFLRRGTNYGPVLPENVYDDDGHERGGVFLFIGAHLRRQFEFVQRQWIMDGNFINHSNEQDPIVGNPSGSGMFTVPGRPVRKHYLNIPQFVSVRGGEYLFLPGIKALKWISEL